MAVPEQLVMQRVKEVVEVEFAAEALTVAFDKLLRANGRDGHAIGVSPIAATEVAGLVQVLEVTVLLQMYSSYEDKIDEFQSVDPTFITGWADRLRRAFETQSAGTTDDFWFLRLVSIEFPDDPTGNKSRLEATFTARMDNPASC